MMKKTAACVRRALLSTASNVSVFVTAAFFVTGLLVLGPYVWWREYIDMLERYIIIPWGMALCLLRLDRRAAREEESVRWDLWILFALLVWLVVPFAIRFGNTFNNAGSWHNSAVTFFGLYALTTEETAQRREKLFDLASLLFAVCSVALGCCLLYCVATVQKFGEDEFAFGVCNGIYLCANGHYNTSGMVAVCAALMSLAGVCRLSCKPVRALCLLGCVLMTVVTVLTQSRTARYALIIAYAVGVYGLLAANARMKRAWVRHAAGLLAAVVTAGAGYVLADTMNNAVIAHYNRTAQLRAETADAKTVPQVLALVTAAAAEETETDTKTEAPAAQLEAREAVDASFSGRTAIWRNLLNRWKESPKYFLIGYGVGRIGRQVTENTIHEGREGVSIHNGYLQYIADYGMIGFALLCAFFALLTPGVVRVFYARGGRQKPGYRVLCMMGLACLICGMMESSPLGAMSPMNMMLFYALALLSSRDRDMKTCKGA